MNVQICHGPPHLNHPMTPRQMQMFDYCAIAGEVWSANVDGELEFCWGVVPPSFMSDTAYLWMMSLPVKHPMVLMRYSNKIINILLDRWPSITGHCQTGKSMRWLQWLGAEFGQPMDGLVPFEIRRLNND